MAKTNKWDTADWKVNRSDRRVTKGHPAICLA